MATWISSDHHFGEDRFHLMQRPFKTTEQHDSTIIANHNAVVAEDDLVVFNGDVLYKNCDVAKYLPLISTMKGRKILVRGNHDAGISDEMFAPYFERIVPEGDGLEMEINGIPLYVTHYPTQAVTDRFNLTGHIHGAWKFQLNMLNVGVDVHSYCPLNLEEVPFYLKAITEFYDNDVWIAYSEQNMAYRESRGKKSTYFVKKG